MGIMEYIEFVGIYFGDSLVVLFIYSFLVEVVNKMVEYVEKLVKVFNICGLINIQFVIKDDNVYVIEVNLWALRIILFIVKVYQVFYFKIVIKVMMGMYKLKDFDIKLCLGGFVIKVLVFFFNKFLNVDKNFGLEMKFIGEGICFIKDFLDFFFWEFDKQWYMYLI